VSLHPPASVSPGENLPRHRQRPATLLTGPPARGIKQSARGKFPRYNSIGAAARRRITRTSTTSTTTPPRPRLGGRKRWNDNSVAQQPQGLWRSYTTVKLDGCEKHLINHRYLRVWENHCLFPCTTMPAADPNTTPSAPKSSSAVNEELSYYKSQYEQLESELADFQTSSRELEAELEKDIEASEKRERRLKEKVESLGYEVEEWKVSYSFRYCAIPRLISCSRHRRNTSKPRPRPTPFKVPFKRRSQPFEMATVLYS
jgi:hypothetical protein